MSKTLEKPLVRRQSASVVYEMNASICIFRREFLENTNILHSSKKWFMRMTTERSVDIDNLVDFKIVETLMLNKLDDNFADFNYKQIP